MALLLPPRDPRGEVQPGRRCSPLCFRDSPVYDELVVGGRFVAYRTHPGRLLLVHLEVEDSVEALQVSTGLCPAGHGQPHLHQLRAEEGGMSRPPGSPHVINR